MGRRYRNPGRTISDFVSFVDFAPTFLELAGLTREAAGMAPFTGRSLTELFRSPKSGRIVPERDHVLIGRERQDIGRPGDAGYPVRGIVTERFLYLHNFETNRWPSGNPETGYLDTDAGATKTVLLEAHRTNASNRFWQMNFGQRPTEEFYDLVNDADCVSNLADSAAHERERASLKRRLFSGLKAQEDPRVLGQGSVFDGYPHAAPGHVGFYDRFMRGEKLKAGWVNESDFEKKPVE